MPTIPAGHKRFRKNRFPQEKELFSELSQGQHPKAVVVACSDSRVDPNLILDRKPGELFVIRNAGNLVPAFSALGGGEEATLEYAINALEVEHAIVCGHSSCGAMGGLLNPEALEESLPSVAQWLGHARSTRAVLDAVAGEAPPEERLRLAIEINALQQLDNLLTHPSVSARVALGKLQLHAWVYDIGSGEIRTYDADAGNFVPLGDEMISVPTHPCVPAYAVPKS